MHSYVCSSATWCGTSRILSKIKHADRDTYDYFLFNIGTIVLTLSSHTGVWTTISAGGNIGLIQVGIQEIRVGWKVRLKGPHFPLFCFRSASAYMI